MEAFRIRVSDPVTNMSIDLTIPSGCLENISRWFLNEHNHLELHVVDRLNIEI